VISEALYTAPDVPSASLRGPLERLLRVRSRATRRRRVTCLDTFDGRIAASGGQLLQVAEGPVTRLEWRPRERQPRVETALSGPAAFVWDLPAGPMATQLQPIVDVRRLVPVVEVDLRGQLLDVVDHRSKTVARIGIDAARARQSTRARWHALPTLVTLTALRGYEDEFKRVQAIVESRPGLQRSLAGLQGLGLQAIGASPPRDLSRLDVVPMPAQRADAGVRQIHRALLGIMLGNEPGLRADLDTEFLHDYRVALRRTRSLLAQIREVLPPAAVGHFREGFGWLGQVTGPTRDLDVLGLALRQVPDDSGGEVAALRHDIAARQRRVHRVMVRHLDGRRCRTLFSDWAHFLDNADQAEPEPANASRPFGDIVCRRIWRLYRRLAERAALVSDDSPPSALHQLRIATKKLRYLTDLTRGMHPRGEIDDVFAALKKLQTVLGDYNDTIVHERLLLDHGRILAETHPERASALLTIGSLTEQFRARRAPLRPRVLREVRRFCGHDMRSRFRRLFKTDAADDES